MSIINPEETRPIHVSENNSNLEDTKKVDVTQPISVGGDPNSIEKTMPINNNLIEEAFSDDDSDMPLSIADETEGTPPEKSSKKEKSKNRKRKWLFGLAGVFLIALIAGLGAWLGYRSGLKVRLNQEYSQVAMAAVTQYEMGVAEENSGQLNNARKRYEYVIQLDPNFPGIQERLAAVMLNQAETNVPTVVPTATVIPITPTPDLRGIEEKYSSAIAFMRANDWENAVNTLEIVRKEDITFRTADIDGMFYIALRFRGMQKIATGNLEPGIYDLTLSELFAPLDNAADSYRTWARYYLSGASFWGVDWPSVVEIFGEIYQSMPDMVDSSGYSVKERYRIACISYADLLVTQGSYCEAVDYYEQALQIADNDQVSNTLAEVRLICEPPTPTVEATLEPTLGPTPEVTGEPTTEPTVAPTDVPTEEPTAEPTEP